MESKPFLGKRGGPFYMEYRVRFYIKGSDPFTLKRLALCAPTDVCRGQFEILWRTDENFG